MPPPSREARALPLPARYGLAVAMVLATLALRWALIPVIGAGTLYITLFPAMIVVAVTFGVGPGLIGNALGIVLIEALLVEPRGHLQPTVSLAVRSVLMLLTTFYVGRVGDRLRRARAAADAQAVAARAAEAALRAQVALLDSARAEVIAREMQRVVRERAASASPIAPPTSRWPQGAPDVAGLVVAVIGAIVLVGWELRLEALTTLLPGLASMKANTATCFLLAALALLLRRRRGMVISLAALVCLVSGLTLAEYLLGADLGIDQLVVADGGQGAFPGRMAQTTAIGFLLCGAALLLLDVRRRWAWWAHLVLGVAVIVLGTLALLGYAYDVEQLYRFPGYASFALHTAAAFVVLGVGVVGARRDGLAQRLSAPGPGAQLARRLLPAAVFLPFLLGWLGVQGLRLGLFEPELGTGLYALGTMLVLAVLIAWAAGAVDRTEAARRRAEDQLLHQAELMNQAHEPLIVREPGGIIRAWNQGAEALYGFGAAEALGQRDHLLLRTDGPPPDVIDRRLEELGQWQGELAQSTRDGRALLVEMRMTSTRARGGGKLILMSGRDVTARKQAEMALLRSREGLSRLAEASREVMARTELGGMLQAISDAALALTQARMATCGHGFVQGQYVLGGSSRVSGSPGCPPGEMFRLEKGGVHMVLAEGAPSMRLTDAGLRAHGRWWGLPEGHSPLRGLLGVPMRGRNGQPSGMILVTDKLQGEFTEEDETLLTQLAAVASLAMQHVETRISLEESDRRKSEFLAMLSHELRNPLAPIRNSVHILERTAPGSEQARRAQRVIDRQVSHLTHLVDDLLDVTRISRGKVQIRREPLDLAEVVRRAVEDQRSAFAAAAVGLEAAIPDGAIPVHGDRTRMAQVMGNLLHNALKFTPGGGRVTVTVEANDRLRQAVVRVRDTGVGIAPEVLPRLFEPFMQAESTLDRSKGGLGLGLALVKGLVEMHGGTASVESQGAGQGAEFTVRLALDARAAVEAEPAKGRLEEGGARRVLVIEDNVDSAHSLRDVLELGKHAVEVALSGAEGLEKARTFRPEVILCDIGLPGMSGYEVAQAIRADATLRGVRLIALTGYATAEDVVRSRGAGFDEHLAKPPNPDRLLELLGGAGSGSAG